MLQVTKTRSVSDDYLTTLEEVKKQYEQYVEVSELNRLTIKLEEEETGYQPPSLETRSDDRVSSRYVGKGLRHVFLEPIIGGSSNTQCKNPRRSQLV